MSELLKNEEFLGFMECWEREYRCQFSRLRISDALGVGTYEYLQMNHEELLTNQEFLGFMKHWEEGYRCPFALPDWLEEHGCSDLVDAAKWAYAQEGRERYSQALTWIENTSYLYPHPNDDWSLYDWFIGNRLGNRNKHDSIPVKNTANIALSDEMPFPEAILWMLNKISIYLKDKK